MTLPYPYQPSCEAALPILKHMSDMSVRSKQLMRLGVDAVYYGDLMSAVGLLDEAADLGLEGAQENALFVYAQLARRCSDAEGPFASRE